MCSRNLIIIEAVAGLEEISDQMSE